jgi:4a-hydroxytetrahydrobiopterin dehydratase
MLSNGGIEKEFAFRNFHQTMAFVNAVAWVAHSQDHHPDLEVHYKSCRIRFSTHAAAGVTENDLICAARVEKLLAG